MNLELYLISLITLLGDPWHSAIEVIGGVDGDSRFIYKLGFALYLRNDRLGAEDSKFAWSG